MSSVNYSLVVCDNIVPFILNISYPRECWEYKRHKFDIKNKAQKLARQASFSKLQMEKGSSVGEYLPEVQILINSLSDIGNHHPTQ
jgi:hypothetical protein